jgi:hypothetical protein
MITVAQVPDRFKEVINKTFELRGVTPYSIEVASYGVVYPNMELEGRGLGTPSHQNGTQAVAEYKTNPRGYARVALLVYNEYLTKKFFSDYRIPVSLQNNLQIRQDVERQQSELTEETLVRMVPEKWDGRDSEGEKCEHCGETHPPLTAAEAKALLRLITKASDVIN